MKYAIGTIVRVRNMRVAQPKSLRKIAGQVGIITAAEDEFGRYGVRIDAVPRIGGHLIHHEYLDWVAPPRSTLSKGKADEEP
jgi:hypothetical protein